MRSMMLATVAILAVSGAASADDKVPPDFVAVTPLGPPPYASGAYWFCSLGGARPTCAHFGQHGSGTPLVAQPWTPELPPGKGKLRALVGPSQAELDALDADGVWWHRDQRHAWNARADTRGTTILTGHMGMICGATAKGVWCDASSMVRFDVGQPRELTAAGYSAVFSTSDGRVGLIDGRDYKPLTLKWSSALQGSHSLTIQQSLACGITAAGQLVCAAFSAPDRALAVGSPEVGGRSAVGVAFAAVRAAGGSALFALAKDGRVFGLRPPDEEIGVFAVGGVDLVGEITPCIVRRSGPWYCVP